jgi:hypothetical protein
MKNASLDSILHWSTIQKSMTFGGGGIRKIRWNAVGRGKSGGVRVIYFRWTGEEKILLLDIYAKNEKENLTPAEVKNLKGKVIE